MGRLAEFEVNHKDEHQKVMADRHLSPTLRDEFLTHIDGCTGSLYSHADGFFNSNKCKGPPVALEVDEAVGHLRSRESFLDWMQTSLGMGDIVARELLTSILGQSDAVERVEQIRDTMAAVPLHSHIVWAFRNATNRVDPFVGLDAADLPCLLGLKDLKAEYLAMGFKLPSAADPKAPTAFDPGMNNLPYWSPGGVSAPHGPCSSRHKTGLPEVVFQGKSTTYDAVTSEFNSLLEVGT